MLDLIKANMGHVVTFIQEKYGELTKEEIDSIKGDPDKLFNLVEEKFGVRRDEVEKFLGDKLQNETDLNDVESVATDVENTVESVKSPIDGMLKDKIEGRR
ncbi:hypothetical protein ACWOAQ_02495 [Helcococcus kunzii]